MSALVFVTLLVAVPFVLVVATSFLKFSVVFAILRARSVARSCRCGR